MKKILSLLLSLLLLFSFSAFAFAEEDVTSYNWATTAARSLEVFPGHNRIYTIEEVDALIWLPDIFLPVNPSEEDFENGCIGMFVVEDSDAFVLLSYSDLSGITLDALSSYYTQNGRDARIVTVNGIPALLVRDAENNNLSLSYQTRDGLLFQVVLSPALDDNYASLYEMVIASIQPTLEEDTDEPAPAPQNPVSSLISK